MILDVPFHTSERLSDSERKTMSKLYPSMAHLDFKAPVTILTAERAMNKCQRYEVYSSKQPTQYQSSLYITHSRNIIAFRVINPFFTLKSGDDANYTLPLDELQNTLIQQTAARKATREATITKSQRCRANHDHCQSSGSFLTFTDQQSFQPGPPRQQGGDTNNFRANNSSKNHKRNNNPFRHGRLSKYLTDWTTISNNSCVNTAVEHGYNILFHTLPPITENPTPIIPFFEEQFHPIDQATLDLLQKLTIEKISPHKSRIFQVTTAQRLSFARRMEAFGQFLTSNY
ncbi:hypothetical protein [Parasitella parasitica]|uniref:Uncharacterized protein n=1 Tax=Parasitella parasitica TaxID=35722 RepID=A0A0B7NAA3_9FUNG|nr:hypothetical protein [Parasitella parasitica]